MQQCASKDREEQEDCSQVKMDVNNRLYKTTSRMRKMRLGFPECKHEHKKKGDVRVPPTHREI